MGRTDGIPHFGSIGITDFTKKCKPKTFNDLVNIIALYRPAPLKNGMAEDYANNRITFPNINSKEIEEILSDSRGCVIYQEHLMLIAHRIGGLSLEDSDLLRTSIAQGNKEQVALFHKKFIEGSYDKGIAQETCQDIWNVLAKFSAFSFCKAHAVAYTKNAYNMMAVKILRRGVIE